MLIVTGNKQLRSNVYIRESMYKSIKSDDNAIIEGFKRSTLLR